MPVRVSGPNDLLSYYSGPIVFSSRFTRLERPNLCNLFGKEALVVEAN